MKDKINLFKQFLKDNFYSGHHEIWLYSYAETMNKFNDYNNLKTNQQKIVYFENVILKDEEYFKISINDAMLMEDIKLYYE